MNEDYQAKNNFDLGLHTSCSEQCEQQASLKAGPTHSDFFLLTFISLSTLAECAQWDKTTFLYALNTF